MNAITVDQDRLPMTKGERDDLARLVRQREKVAKSMASQRSAELLADFESQLATVYSFDNDAIWKEATALACKAADDAQAIVAARCRELGIPERFAPQIGSPVWYGRGENAIKGRRVELRRVATTRIAASEKEARVSIERHSVELQTELVAGGLFSDAAQRFLERMPAVETLMPAIEFGKIDALLSIERSAK